MATIETVFGVDPIAALVRELLGEPVEHPPSVLVEGGRAAASPAVIPTGAGGTPWGTNPRWLPNAVDRTSILSPGTTVRKVGAFAMPSGATVPDYDPSGGSRNRLGVFVVRADDAETPRRDCEAVPNRLGAAVTWAARGGVPRAGAARRRARCRAGPRCAAGGRAAGRR